MGVLKFIVILVIIVLAPYLIGASYPTMKYETIFEKWFIGSLVLLICGFVVYFAILLGNLLS